MFKFGAMTIVGSAVQQSITIIMIASVMGILTQDNIIGNETLVSNHPTESSAIGLRGCESACT